MSTDIRTATEIELLHEDTGSPKGTITFVQLQRPPLKPATDSLTDQNTTRRGC